MLLSNQQKYILEILKEFKYLRVRQLHALVQAHYRTQGIKIDERRMEIMLRQMRTGTNYVWLRGDVVSYGDRRIDPRLTRLYKNEAGQMLQFNYVYDPNETDIYVIAPTATVDDAVVNGYAADFIISGDERAANVLMWIDSNNCAFYISAYLEKEDLVNLAESLYEK